MDSKDETQATGTPELTNRKRMVRTGVLLVWVAVLLVQAASLQRDPSGLNLTVAGVLVLLCVVVNAQIFLRQWFAGRGISRAMTRLHGSAYLSELDNLPNRNYLLSELRREMPRSRSAGVPFVLILLSLETFDEIAERRGADFGTRSLRGLSQVLKRFTRTSDFISHLGGPRFCVMLNECRHDDASIYLQRVPGSIAVSDGHHMLEVPVTARVHEYDMENLYATDVLRDAEESQPLRRKDKESFTGEAA